MSDILIKGMEMPTSCHKCEFVDILPTCPCNQMADEDFWNNVSLAIEGHKDCPLIPVPEHGRLIDADALIQSKEVNTFEAVFAVAKAPTIIPAEEGE